MLFNSFQFFLFFPIVTILFFLLPHKFRWFLLLAASCYFYMVFKPIYILILFFTIVIDYYVGLFLEKSKAENKKLILILSLIANIGILAFFKYWNFLNDNITALLGLVHTQNPIPYLEILLPIGLSFHTFQAMSYTIEVYRGNQKAEHHFGIYALYVMFYPQLVAGPIERPQNVLHQFHDVHHFDYQQFKEGLKRMLWGLFKKVVIADNLSRIVNLCYDSPTHHSGLLLFISTIFFTFQIYCDFSGYSDIALGSAQCMGFKLMTNFNLPYISKNISEFWSRWHISLSTWFRDYLYIPLGGNRVGKQRWMMNVFIVFIVSGLWHGANYTFIIWGTLHGIYTLIGIVTKNFQSKFIKSKILNIAFTFGLVAFAWIFFRAKSVAVAMQIVFKIIAIRNYSFAVLMNELSTFGTTKFAIISILLLLFILVDKYITQLLNGDIKISTFKNIFAFSLMLAMLCIFGYYGETQFIYFQF